MQEKVTRTLLECIEAAAERAGASQADLHRTAAALQQEIRSVEATLRAEMRRLKSTLFKWFLAFWLGAILLFAAILLTLLSYRPS